MPYFNRFDICEAYACLEWDYNLGGWLHERSSNQRRREATAVQLHRMQFHARPNLSTDTLTENGREIYDAAVQRLNLPVQESMFVLVTDDRDGAELLKRKLADDELLDCDLYAQEYAQQSGFELHQSDGYIPTGCADFTVTIQREPGSVVCWNSKSYFIKSGE